MIKVGQVRLTESILFLPCLVGTKPQGTGGSTLVQLWARDARPAILQGSRLFQVTRQRGQEMSEVCMDL
jgi:hypothetical protein